MAKDRIMMLLFALFCAAVTAQTTQMYQRQTVYQFNDCTGASYVVRAKKVDTCTAARTCNNAAMATDCVTGVPPQFEGAVSLTTYSNGTNCGGNPNELLSFVNNICVQYLGVSYNVQCNSGKLTFIWFTQTNVCLGEGYYTQVDGGQCRSINNTQMFPPGFNLLSSGLMFATCTAAPCFHESSEIVYNGKISINLDSLLAGKDADECSSPHVLNSAGVAIETTCSQKPLRLTNDHLVYTSTGLRTARSVVKGDTLYSDMEQRNACIVKSVTGEYNQKYFALNCRNSDVITNGIKTSTFGITHYIPATWMKYGSMLLGVQRASQLGDKVASALSYLNLI